MRAMEASDIDAVIEIEHRSFSTPWHRMAFVNGLHIPHTQTYIVECGSNPAKILPGSLVVGYASFQQVADEIHLLKIAVRPEWRRRGIGRYLLDYCIDDAGREGFFSVILEVRRSNSEAIDLYRGFGFEVISIRPNYYTSDTGHKEDAMLMRKQLKRR